MEDFGLGISPAVEALRKTADPRSVHTAHQLPGVEGRLTPLELDANLQVSEIMYRNLLLGKKVQMDFNMGMDSWYKEIFGEDWVKKNLAQRRELERQAKETGENTPMWVEAASGSADLAAEVLQLGPTGGECLLRNTHAVDREAVLELLQGLLVKLQISHYARCGCGEKQNGLRAMVGVMWHFYADPEVLSCCADSLRMAITDNKYNCDSLLAIWTPVYPEERHHDQVERGWSFLRIALDAFAFQAGGQIHPRSEPSAASPAGAQRDAETALKVARCVLAAKGSAVMEAQLRLLQSSGERREQKDLQEMLPKLIQVTKDLAGKLKGNDVLSDLLQLLETS